MFLPPLQCTNGSLYSFTRDNEGSNPSDLKEGQESYESDPSQGKLQNDLDYAHIPMYTTIRGISAYVRGYQGKGCVYHFSYIFSDGQ